MTGTYYAVYEPIRLVVEQRQAALLESVLPKYTRLDNPELIGEIEVTRAYNGFTFVGAAVKASGKGFGDDHMTVLVGFDKDGNIINYLLLENKETLGFGSQVDYWFKMGRKSQSIIGKNPSSPLGLTSEGGTIDGISAATYTSQHFLNIINHAYQAFIGNEAPDAMSGATS